METIAGVAKEAPTHHQKYSSTFEIVLFKDGNLRIKKRTVIISNIYL